MASAPTTSSGATRRLDLLPPELIDHIFSFLIPPMPEIGETRPIGGYEKLLPEEPWYEPTRCRAALRASCLVSKKIRAIAEPYQYHSVALLSVRQFVSFLRTLAARHEDIARWTRYLSVHLTLNNTEVYTIITEQFRALPATTWSTSTHEALKTLVIFRQGKRKKKGDKAWLSAIPECLLMAMLTVLSKTETLLLQIPVVEVEDQPQYTALLETFHYNTNISVGKSLRRLLLQTDPEVLSLIHDDIEANGDPGVTASSAGVYWPILVHCPNITTLEVTHDDGSWCTSHQFLSAFCLAAGGCSNRLARLKHVYLNNTYVNPQNVADLLAHMPELETLYIDPKWTEENEAWMDTPSPRTLDESLERSGKKLRRLDLGFFECADAKDSIGEDGYLTCLPKLSNIEQLHIQLGLLFPEAPEPPSSFSSRNPAQGPPGSLARVRTESPSLSQRLPPDVVDLGLEDWWWRPDPPRSERRFAPLRRDEDTAEDDDVRLSRYYQSYGSISHRRSIVAGLLRFAEEVRAGALPKLRSVLFLVRTGEQWTFPGLRYHEIRDPSQVTLTSDEKALVEMAQLMALGDGAMYTQLTKLLAMADEAHRPLYARLAAIIEGVERYAHESADEGGPASKWRRFKRVLQAKDLARSENAAGPRLGSRTLALEPLTLQEHMNEVAGLFESQGIKFKVGEM